MIALSVAKLKYFSLNKAEKERLRGKFGSIPTFRSTRKGKKCFCDEPACLTRYYITSHLHQVFFDFVWSFSRFSLIFRISKLFEFKEFNKTIIPFTLVGYETYYRQLGATHLVGY